MEVALPADPPLSWAREELDDNIVVLSVKGEPTDTLVEEFLAENLAYLTRLRSRARRISIVIDLTETSKVTAKQRSRLGGWRAEHQDLLVQVIDRGVYIAPGAIMRGVLTAVFWFAQPKVPVEVKKNRGEALAWLRSFRRS